VGDGDPGGDRGANRGLDSLAELAGGLDVVGQDEDLLGKEVVLGLEEVSDALDDDTRFAGSCAGNNHQRTIAVLDDLALLVREWGSLALAGTGLRYGD